MQTALAAITANAAKVDGVKVSLLDKDRESADVKAIAKAKLTEIDRKLAELTELRDTLRHLVRNCHGDKRPDCPIIEGLAGKDRVSTQPI